MEVSSGASTTDAEPTHVDQAAGNSIGVIIASSATMIDRVAARAMRATLKQAQLARQAPVVGDRDQMPRP
jgi:hypothetical protein